MKPQYIQDPILKDFEGNPLNGEEPVWIGDCLEAHTVFPNTRMVDSLSFKQHFQSTPIRKIYSDNIYYIVGKPIDIAN